MSDDKKKRGYQDRSKITSDIFRALALGLFGLECRV